MGEPALRIFDPDETGAAQATPAGEPKPAPGPWMTVDSLGMISARELVPVWLDGKSEETRARGVRRYAEGLAQNPATAGLVEKLVNGWHFSPRAPDPTMPPESGSTLRDFLFLRTGRVVHDLLGVYIPPTLVEQIPTWTEAKRRRFFTMCELARQLRAHEQRFTGVERRERDRLFRADPERQGFCAAHGIKKWSGRSLREFRRDTERGIDWWDVGRPRHDEDANAERFSPAAQDFFRVELCRTQRKLPSIYRDAVVRAEHNGWSVPSLRTVRRWAVENLPPAILDYHRLGPRKWAAKHAPFIERDLTGQYAANQMWVGDHHQLDFWILHNGKWGRPWLTGWLDMGSRKIVGWWISLSPNSDTLLAAFRLAVLTYGAPLEILVDNGKDYKAKGVTGKRAKLDQQRVDGVMQRLGITVRWALKYHPQSKPIERLFGTVCEDFSKRFESYCGRNPESRHEELNGRLRAGAINLSTLGEVCDLFAAWVEVYHNRPHGGEGMKDRTPAEVFATNSIPKRTAPREVLDLLLMRIERAKVGRNGVRVAWHHANYGQGNLALFPLQGQDVDVRIDPINAGVVYVQDLEGRFICEARNERLRGVTPDEVREGARRRAAARKLAKSAIGASQASFRSVTEHAQQLAGQRHYLEAQAAQRVAVGAEGQADPRGIQLLPGAAEAAASLAALGRRGAAGASRGVPSAASRLASFGATVEPAAETPPLSYARFLDLGVEDARDWAGQPAADLSNDGLPRMFDEPLDDDDYAPTRPEPPAPVRDVLAGIGDDEGEQGDGDA